MKGERRARRIWFGAGDDAWSCWDPTIAVGAPIEELASDYRWLTNPGLVSAKDAIAKLRAIRRVRLVKP